MADNKPKRKYTKTSPHWENRKKVSDIVSAPTKPATVRQPFADYTPESYGESFASTTALGGGTSSYRGGKSSTQSSYLESRRYENIREGLMPWEKSGSIVSMSDAISLCQKAYANFAPLRNTVEIMTEFTNAKIILKGGNKRVRDFIDKWLQKCNMSQCLDEIARELNISSNGFIWRLDGKLRDEDFSKMQQATAAKTNILPLRYIVLNPATIGAESGISYDYNYVKMLSQYEIERLRNPKTPEEQAIYDGLPAEVKTQIKRSSGSSSSDVIYMPMDTSKLTFLFTKKQSYWPMAIPMIYPLLNDIEFKLMLKKMDASIARTVEHVILLVTTGEKVDEHGGGVNPKAIARLQELFKNETVGRVLVADYTTKAEWVIPDIGKIIGKEKYEVVNKDIQEGLQMIFVGDEKFANSQTKVKVFLERLKYTQDLILTKFLQPEIDRICEYMNFKNVPTASFAKIDLEDETQVAKVYLRMAELGLLTPDELNNALENGVLPDKESNIENQKEYKSLRDKGYYFPLVGGSKEGDEGGKPAGSTGPKKSGQIGVSKAAEEQYSIKSIATLLAMADRLENKIEKSLKTKFKIEKLNEAQLMVANTLAKTIIANEAPEKWSESVESYIVTPKEIQAETASQIDDIAIKYGTDTYMAAILLKSKISV